MIFENSKNDWLAKELKREGFEGCVEHDFTHILNSQDDITFKNKEKSDWADLNKYEKSKISKSYDSTKTKKQGIGLGIGLKILLFLCFICPFLIPIIMPIIVLSKLKK